MAKPNKSTLQAGVLIAAVIVCAILARVFGNLGYAPAILGLIRTMLYIGLYMAWGVSVRKRVVQAQVRKCLTAVSVLTVFWLTVRTMKYFLVFDLGAARYLWYLYYLPMLFIPLLGVYVSVSLGKPERFQLKWSLLLYIPTMLCLLLVLTNDFHQLVFTFPTGEVWSDENNGYVPGYYIVIGWEIVCALTAFIIMVIKCRISPRKKHLPIIILGTSIVYAVIYFSGVRWMRIIGGDITAVQCLMFTAVFESCIQCAISPAPAAKKARKPLSTVNLLSITGILLPVLLLRPALSAVLPKAMLSVIPKVQSGSLMRITTGMYAP